MKNVQILLQEIIEKRILFLRSQKAMLDYHLVLFIWGHC